MLTLERCRECFGPLGCRPLSAWCYGRRRHTRYESPQPGTIPPCVYTDKGLVVSPRSRAQHPHPYSTLTADQARDLAVDLPIILGF